MEINFSDLSKLNLGIFNTALLARLDGKLKLFDIVEDNLPGREGITTGYYPTKSYVYLAHTIPTISHEIAHMVEIKDSRITLPDWGLDNYSNTMKTITTSAFIAGLARETRVRAIAAQLEKPNYERVYHNPAWIQINSGY